MSQGNSYTNPAPLLQTGSPKPHNGPFNVKCLFM